MTPRRPAVPPSPLATRRGRLLVVDDQPINVRLLHHLLAPEHEVFAATGGARALALCQQMPAPDLVLLDVMMPGMDGMEVCRRLKRDPATAGIPVIFVTGGVRSDEENACWAAGGADFVEKPFNLLTLRNRVRAHLQLKFHVDALRILTVTDSLTELANRRHFDAALEAEWSRCSRSGLPLALLMLDVDHFKRFNDRYGHPAGDDCLRRVAATLQAGLRRPFDLAARYGGEEFACLLPETAEAGALKMAAQLEAAVRALAIEHADAVATVVTVSVGVAVVRPERDGDGAALVARADTALYSAKQGGRGRVCAADATDAQSEADEGRETLL